MPPWLLLLLLLLPPHPFNSLISRITWVRWYQKGKTSLDLNKAGDDGVLGWQWHRLDHMQTICTSAYLHEARCRLFTYGPADATAIPKTPSPLASLNYWLVLPFWCQLTLVVLEKPGWMGDCFNKTAERNSGQWQLKVYKNLEERGSFLLWRQHNEDLALHSRTLMTVQWLCESTVMFLYHRHTRIHAYTRWPEKTSGTFAWRYATE